LLTPQEIADLLARLQFDTEIEGETVRAQTPPHRLDIGQGLVGKADLLEEVARMYGYNNIPATRLADVLPSQTGNPQLEKEERLRDILVSLDLQEVITYRLTSPEREARAVRMETPPDDLPYVRLANPIAADRTVMRRSLLASVLEILERNARNAERLAFFEIGPVFLPVPNEDLPAEQERLVIVMTGLRNTPSWDRPEKNTIDFYDLKGILEAALNGMHIGELSYTPTEHPSFHPGKCAQIAIGGIAAGVLGELHPLVKENYEFGSTPVLAAELDLQAVLQAAPRIYAVQPVPVFPPVLEDIAVIVDESLPAERIVDVIQRAGGNLLTGVRLFDIYRGAQIGADKKSMAYSLTYQAPDRTLTDDEAAKIRQRVIRRLEEELGAKLRS
jgi:phenylalanyl-tRNA synthetase beta chain